MRDAPASITSSATIADPTPVPRRRLPRAAARGPLLLYRAGLGGLPDDPDGYVWIRRWESEEQRERISEAVYGSTEWLDELQPAVRALMARERTTVTMLAPTPTSPLR